MRLVLVCFLSCLLVACSKPDLVIEKNQTPFPFKPIAKGEGDPADYGPDDETVLNAIDGTYAPVPFRHFTHSSNAESGYGIDCLVCHHDAETADDAGTPCVDCHDADVGNDDALLGPDNNMNLELDEQTITATPFSHYSHASFVEGGYKISCERCHHMQGDMSPCSKCHKKLALRGADGKTVPKIKRAFHLQCRDCHIKSQNKNAPVTCTGCHRPMVYTKTKDVLPLSRSYHVMCINCHRQVNANSYRTAPIACDGCHKKKK